MPKKPVDLNEKRELKTAKQISDKAVGDLCNSVMIIDNLKKELEEANNKIKHLEDLLKNANKIPNLERKPHEEEIILVELKRMHDEHVLKNIPLTEKDDIKKLEILVKCLVSLRSGQSDKKKKKEKDMSIAKALELVKTEFN